jgi:serine kinase of HPr protein (carbohydrate metabolism regulator)
MERVYGTCVAINGKAVLLRGPSGSGKSDLALRVIENGGRLVADDQTILVREADQLVASCPDTISGQLEVRGIGIIPVETVRRAPLALVMDMLPVEQIERFPEFGRCSYLGVDVPLLGLAPFEASAAAKVRLALNLAEDT